MRLLDKDIYNVSRHVEPSGIWALLIARPPRAEAFIRPSAKFVVFYVYAAAAVKWRHTVIAAE